MTTTSVDDVVSKQVRDWLAHPPAGQLVDGRECEGSSNGVLVDLDPATGKVLAHLTSGSANDVDSAVEAARRAFDDGRWSELDPERRERFMGHLAGLMERDKDLLAQLESVDTGKPLGQARTDVDEAVSVVRYFAGWATKTHGSVIPAPRRYLAMTTLEPIGVCASITPWNYPLPILTYKLGPALAMGNTVVAKPSELAPLSTLHLARLCAEAGFPDGVVNVVTGGPDVGTALASHPLVDKIAFTGSTRVGTEIMRSAAANLTKVSLELGGKSPHIVFADADLDTAVDAVMEGIWSNAGQLCIAGSRLLIQESVRDDFVSELIRRTRGLKVGHGLAPDTDVGPVISSDSRDRISLTLEAAVKDGAEVALGGEPTEPEGFFVNPTVVVDVVPGSAIEQEEVFGPVLAVVPFTGEDEAVSIANGTPYGLAAGLWTSDAGRAHAVSRRLRSGTVWVNTYGIFHPTLPFGGVKTSGFGRELGESALAHYTESKTYVQDVAVQGSRPPVRGRS